MTRSHRSRNQEMFRKALEVMVSEASEIILREEKKNYDVAHGILYGYCRGLKSRLRQGLERAKTQGYHAVGHIVYARFPKIRKDALSVQVTDIDYREIPLDFEPIIDTIVEYHRERESRLDLHFLLAGFREGEVELLSPQEDLMLV